MRNPRGTLLRECKHPKRVVDSVRGETVCSICGEVLQEEIFNRGPEWRYFTQEERMQRSRVGPPSSHLFHTENLPTTISNIAVNKTPGNKIQWSKRQEWARLKWVNRYVHYSKQKNLIKARKEFSHLSEKISIPQTFVEDAAYIYLKAFKNGLIQGRSIVGMVSAALLMACRRSRKPRTLSEIANASKATKKEIVRCCKILLRDLKLQVPQTDPLIYMSKIADGADVSGNAQGLAVRLLKKAKMKRANLGRNPSGTAAGALYLACLLKGTKTTQKELARAAGVTEVTLRKGYRTLRKKLNVNAGLIS